MSDRRMTKEQTEELEEITSLEENYEELKEFLATHGYRKPCGSKEE